MQPRYMAEVFRMKVIVCGSREWNNEWCRTLVDNELERLIKSNDEMFVIHGGCSKGADRFASEWCKRTLPHVFAYEKVYVADWDKEGKKAGLVRNQQMADDGADLCLAFWNGTSKGTEYMIKAAAQAGIIVKIIPAPRYNP